MKLALSIFALLVSVPAALAAEPAAPATPPKKPAVQGTPAPATPAVKAPAAAPAKAQVKRPAVTKQQTKVFRPAAAPAPVTEPGRFLVGLAGGYHYGIGDVKSPSAEADLGYLLDVLDNSLSVGLSGGWYTASEIEKVVDSHIGPFENEWHLTAIPLALNALYWHRFSNDLTFVGGAGLEYVLATFTFESRNALGDIDPEDVTSGAAIGTRLQGGVRYAMGPGAITGMIKYSTSNIKNDLSELTGDLGGMAVVAGYEFAF